MNISASPFRVGVFQTRRELIATRAADHQCTIAYTNAVGANDGLIFDGGGCVNQNGKIMLEAPALRAGFRAAVVDLDRTLRLRAENTTWREDRHEYLERFDVPDTLEIPADGVLHRSATRDADLSGAARRGAFSCRPNYPVVTAREQLCEEILDALALGVGDYFEKNGVFKLIGIALSGGRDSLLTLLIAHRYASKVRPDDPGSLIRAFYLPSRYSSEETRIAAQTICADLGVPLTVASIDDAFEREMKAAETMLDAGQALTPITQQNIQARIRAQRMWNWSNSSGGLFLQTGNMTEKAVGYTTVGGDLMGALAVIANVPKTVVMYLLDYLLENARLCGHRGGAAKTGRSGAGPQPVRRRGADALPGAGRLLLPLRRGEADARRSRDRRGGDVPRYSPRHGRWLRGEVRPALPAVHLQVGAVAAVAAHRQPGPGTRARAAAARRHQLRVDPIGRSAPRSAAGVR